MKSKYEKFVYYNTTYRVSRVSGKIFYKRDGKLVLSQKRSLLYLREIINGNVEVSYLTKKNAACFLLTYNNHLRGIKHAVEVF